MCMKIIKVLLYNEEYVLQTSFSTDERTFKQILTQQY